MSENKELKYYTVIPDLNLRISSCYRDYDTYEGVSHGWETFIFTNDKENNFIYDATRISHFDVVNFILKNKEFNAEKFEEWRNE